MAAGGDAFAGEMLGRSKANRLKSLADDGKTPPFFGRTDRLRDDDDDSAPCLEQFHIGRRHIRDDAGDPVVIDWRPMSRLFYQATAPSRCRDIVAAIAPDQDDMVRAPLETSLCIQGSPGTGKPAVDDAVDDGVDDGLATHITVRLPVYPKSTFPWSISRMMEKPP